MAICIPKEITDKLRTAIKSGAIDFNKLYDMNSAERNAVFSKYTGKDSASMVNAEYEKSRIIAEKRAASDFVTFSEKKGFAKLSTKGEFSKKLLTTPEKQKLDISKIEKQIKDNQSMQSRVSDAVQKSVGERKANLNFKLSKLKGIEEKLNVRLEDTKNPLPNKMVNKINKLSGMLSDENYSDLIKAKMGNDISTAQGKYIIDKAIELKQLAKGNANDSAGLTVEYDNAKNSLDSYVANLNPNKWDSMVRNIIDTGRNFLIMGLSTPLKVMMNYTNYFGRKVLTRISERRFTGNHSELIRGLMKEDKIFLKKTGGERSTFTSMEDTNSVLGSSDIGKAPQGERFGDIVENQKAGLIEKGIGKVAKISHKISINIEHTLAFNYVYRHTFYDTLHFHAMDISKLEGLKGTEAISREAQIIKDANMVEPKMEAGIALRNRAQAVASMVTNVDRTWVSQASLGVKNTINKAATFAVHGTLDKKSEVPLGDILIPMAKIPANVIYHGLKTSPIGMPISIWDMVRGKIAMSNLDLPLEERYVALARYKKGVTGLGAQLGSVGVGIWLTNSLTAKDFKTDKWGNTYIKIGAYWVNTEYFGRISPTVAGMMALKLNSKRNIVSGFLTGDKSKSGALSTMLRIPGINAGKSAIHGLTSNPTGSLKKFSSDRFTPAFIKDLMGDRPINRLFFGAHGLETDKQVMRDKVQRAQAKERRAYMGN